jgi:hypothetical protein
MLRKLLSDRVLFTAGVVLISLYVVFPIDRQDWNPRGVFVMSIPFLVGVAFVAWPVSKIISAVASRLRSAP